MDGKRLWSVIGGVALLAVAAFIFITGTDVMYRYVGGGLMVVLGGLALYNGLRSPKQAA